MRLFNTILLLLAFKHFCLANVWEGDYHIRSQYQANQFSKHCKCTIINGDLIVQGNQTLHLDSLHHLKVVKGSINIFYNHTLQSIDGLNNLESIGKDLYINQNDSLKIISSFEQLISVNDDIYISSNALTKINGFNNLSYVKSIEISNNSTLNEITGFNSIVCLSSLDISRDVKKINAFHSLKKVKSGLTYYSNFTAEFSAFEALTEVGRFELIANLTSKQLTTFDKLQKVRTFLFRNSSIEELNVFNNLTSVNTLAIYGCESLKNIDGFINLKQINLLEIFGNTQLISILPFNKLNSLNIIYISRNANLNSLNAFSNLKSAHYITIKGNNNLLEIATFNQLSNVDTMYIENRNLRHLDAFRNLKTIGKLTLIDNIQLRSMDYFAQLSQVGEQVILQNNIQLNECCIANCWLNENVLDESQLVLNNNGEDCSTIETLKTTCIDYDTCPKVKDVLFDLCVLKNPPANQSLTFSLISTLSQNVEYTIFNLNNQLLLKGGLTVDKGFNEKTVRQYPAICKIFEALMYIGYEINLYNRSDSYLLSFLFGRCMGR